MKRLLQSGTVQTGFYYLKPIIMRPLLFILLLPVFAQSQTTSRLLAAQVPARDSSTAWYMATDTSALNNGRIWQYKFDSLKLKYLNLKWFADSLIAQGDRRYIKTIDTVKILAGAGIAVSGTYPNITVSIVQPTIFTTNRSLNSNYTISTTKWAVATYTVTCTSTNPLLAGTSSANFFLEYSTNGGANWTLASGAGNSNGVALTVTVALTNGQTGVLTGLIPANALCRIRTTTAGTASTSVTNTQEWVL